MRRFLVPLWLALVGLHAVLGVTWLAQNAGRIPDYGDTGDYLNLARTLEVDAYRGIGYPAFLAAVHRLPGADGLLRKQSGVLHLQVIQCLVALAALTYFLRVFGLRSVPAGRTSRFALVVLAFLPLLLFLDPLVAHFGLSIMTDSLALSGSLVFCAALADFGLGEGRRAWKGVVLLLAFAATASLRVEKVAVLAVATLATLGAWHLLERGLPREERRCSLRRTLEVAGIVLLGGVAVTSLHGSAKADSRRWPVYDSLVHSRIVFPNVTKVYDELPQNVRSRISPKEARLHDTDSIVGYRVINDATGASGPIRMKDRGQVGRGGTRPSVERERRALLEEIAGVVLRERWAPLAADVMKDALENVLPTFSWYVRLALLARTEPVRQEAPSQHRISPGDGTEKTYETLAQRHPVSSLVYVVSAAALFLASTLLAFAALVRRRRAGLRIARRTWMTWTPVVAFVLANGCAFALRADMVHIRYMLLAHVALVALAYRGAIDWLSGEAKA